MAKFIDIHSHNSGNNQSITLINYRLSVDSYALDSDQFYSVGLHPWDTEKVSIEKVIFSLSELCSQPNILSVGEIGLDKSIELPLDIQNVFFEEQLKIAELFSKPVIIHCVKSYSEAIYRVKRLNVPLIFHGFNKNLQIATSIIDSGGIVSFGSAVFSNKKLQEVLKQLPDDSFFLETDESTVQIEEIYTFVADILNIGIEQLKRQQTNLFNKIFLR